MRNNKAKTIRADLHQLRLDISQMIEEQEARFPIEEKKEEMKEETAPASLEAIAKELLDAIGGGEFRVMRRGEQTCQQRAQELFDAEQRRLKRRW